MKKFQFVAMKKFEVINLTKHAAVLMNEKLEIICNIPPSGKEAKCTESFIEPEKIEVNGVATTLYKKIVGKTADLPEPIEGRLYFVSSFVAADNPTRTDLITPAKYIRGAKGEIIGCVDFAVLTVLNVNH